MFLFLILPQHSNSYMHMKKLFVSIGALAMAAGVAAQTFVSTEAYSWHGDTITLGEYFATAPSETSLVSTYHAQPGYFMPVQGSWQARNDLSAYPKLVTPNRLHTAIYNLGLDEMVNAVEADTTLRTGKEWAGVWTRDVSYSILLSMAYMQPEAARISLEKKVDRLGRIIQDTGSGGAWPVSTDRQIWGIAAWEVYKVTGDRKWLEFIYPVAKRSLETDAATIYDAATGLVRGETSFIDWREQSHPKWMQTADIYSTLTLSTSVVHAQAWSVLADMADMLGKKHEAAKAREQAKKIREAVNRHLWMPQLGLYAMYLYGRDNLIVNPRAETLGESLAIIWNVADADRARTITESNPVTPFGPAIFYPQIADMPAYHNNSLWPWVDAWWTLANAKAGNEQGVMQGFGALFRPAALFCTNKENLNLDNGDIATELNSSNMLWCLAGNIALTHKVLFGIGYEPDRLTFSPFVPEVLGQQRQLLGFKYRNAILNITVEGYGQHIKSFTINGKEQKQHWIPASKAKGVMDVRIVMDNKPIPALKVNRRDNLKAPLTPIVRLEGNTLCWHPIEYINHYEVWRDGHKIAEVRTTTFDTSEAGEYQVVGVADNGTPSFASEPLSNRQKTVYEMPGESTVTASTEIPAEYRPANGISGYSGKGFIEVDKNSAPVSIKIHIPQSGDYCISLRYSNGNGPVNTENRCAIRTLKVDGIPAGIVVMPQRGRANWDDWGYTNSLLLPALEAGEHTVTIEFAPDNENMNIETNHALIDNLRLVKK